MTAFWFIPLKAEWRGVGGGVEAAGPQNLTFELYYRNDEGATTIVACGNEREQ